MKMDRILKLVPTIALVSVIGIALANNQGQTNLCAKKGTTGYGEPLDMNAAPGDPSNTGIVNLGQYGTNFLCSGPAPANCHWVYDSSISNPEDRWVRCNGDYQAIAP